MSKSKAPITGLSPGIQNVDTWIRDVRLTADANEYNRAGAIGSLEVLEVANDRRVLVARFYQRGHCGFGVVVHPVWEPARDRDLIACDCHGQRAIVDIETVIAEWLATVGGTHADALRVVLSKHVTSPPPPPDLRALVEAPAADPEPIASGQWKPVLYEKVRLLVDKGRAMSVGEIVTVDKISESGRWFAVGHPSWQGAWVTADQIEPLPAAVAAPAAEGRVACKGWRPPDRFGRLTLRAGCFWVEVDTRGAAPGFWVLRLVSGEGDEMIGIAIVDTGPMTGGPIEAAQLAAEDALDSIAAAITHARGGTGWQRNSPARPGGKDGR